MRKFILLFSALMMGITGLKAQITVVATFDTLTLSKPDTFYVNYSNSGNDVGFNDGITHFPCVYDTDFGGYWDYGFAYSNMTDSVTSGYTNQYSAKTAIGYDSSANYVVVYGVQNGLYVNEFTYVPGFYITNGTYAYNSMRDGDAFAKKFGGPTGNDPDWFKLTVYGYYNGSLHDSVDFYLADYRYADNDSDYIVNTWKWVDLTSLSNYDSLQFTLSSSDTAGGNGMNTPAYFCMDNYTTIVVPDAVPVINNQAAKVYPNPATDMLYVDIVDNSVKELTVMNMEGQVVDMYQVDNAHMAINTASLPVGMYMLQLSGNGKTASQKFVKQ